MVLQGNEVVVVAESPAVDHQSHTDTSLHDPQYQPDPRYLPDSQYHPDLRYTTQGRPLQPHYSITPPRTPPPRENPTHRHTTGPGVGLDHSQFLSRPLLLPVQMLFLTVITLPHYPRYGNGRVFDFRINRPPHIILL